MANFPRFSEISPIFSLKNFNFYPTTTNLVPKESSRRAHNHRIHLKDRGIENFVQIHKKGFPLYSEFRGPEP